MVEEIIGVSIIAVVLVATAIIYIKWFKSEVQKISFKQSFDLTNLPIITFYNNGNRYNFLLDTGSTDSHINKRVIDSGNIEYEKIKDKKNVFGMEGNAVIVDLANITFTLNEKEFNGTFLVNDLSAAFESIRRESGVLLHGIIGTSFFDKYKYVIDFSKYLAYSKK